MDWSFISESLADACDNFEKSGLTQCENMLSEDFDIMEKEKEVTEDMVVYANRVLARSKSFKIEIPINNAWCDEDRDEASIGNYNYKMFKWATSRGFGDRIDNMFIRFKLSELKKPERESLLARIKKND